VHLRPSTLRRPLLRRPLLRHPRFAAALAAAFVAPALASAQQQLPADPAADSALARAQRLVGAGQGTEGRAVVDSLLGATPSDSPRYPEVLYVRATLSATAAQAERDYRRLFVEYPVSRRAADALMRLAQLEMARGDRAPARAHLERLTREHPGSPVVPRANYWLARVRFEQGDVPRACQALDAARTGAAARDVELRNQVEFYAPRCPRPQVAARDGGAEVGARSAPGAPPLAPGPRDTLAAGAGQLGAVERGAPPTGTVPPSGSPAVTGTVPPVPERRPAPDSARAAGGGATLPAGPPGTPPSAPLPAPGAASRGAPGAAVGAGFSVQVAAYESRSPAEQLAARLSGRGFEARVAGTAAPFRVRIGHYATRAEAGAAAGRLRAQGIEGFVVESEGR
jgi:cell division septation protein DedD